MKMVGWLETYVLATITNNIQLVLFSFTASLQLVLINSPTTKTQSAINNQTVEQSSGARSQNSKNTELGNGSELGLVNDYSSKAILSEITSDEITAEIIQAAALFQEPPIILTNTPLITLSPNNLDFGFIPVGTTTNMVVTIRNIGGGTLTGSASALQPFSIVSGGSYTLASNETQVATLVYSPTSAGNHTQTIAFTGGNGAGAVVNGFAVSTLPDLSFSSTSGTIRPPFIAHPEDYISQPYETSLTSGGHAVYGFSILTAGNYIISINVDAPDISSDSVFINIDGDPSDSRMIWDISPPTSGFEQRTVGWRGTNTPEAPQFAVKTFALAAGTHQLIIRGHDANTKLGQISILKQLVPPSNLRIEN